MVITNSLGKPAALSRQTVRDIVVLGGELAVGVSYHRGFSRFLRSDRSQSR